KLAVACRIVTSFSAASNTLNQLVPSADAWKVMSAVVQSGGRITAARLDPSQFTASDRDWSSSITTVLAVRRIPKRLMLPASDQELSAPARNEISFHFVPFHINTRLPPGPIARVPAPRLMLASSTVMVLVAGTNSMSRSPNLSCLVQAIE